MTVMLVWPRARSRRGRCLGGGGGALAHLDPLLTMTCDGTACRRLRWESVPAEKRPQAEKVVAGQVSGGASERTRSA